MKTYAVIGDLHLGKLSSIIPDHLARQINSLNEILFKVMRMGIEEVVLLGDVLDKPNPDASIMVELIRLFRDHKDLRFHWLTGNHDRHSAVLSSIDILMTIFDANGPRIVADPEYINGVAWLPYPYDDPRDCHTAFAHVDRPGALYENGYRVKGKRIDDGRCRWIIGHIHRAQRVGNNIWYPGTPWQLSFGDRVRDRYWVVIKGKTCAPKKVPIRAPYTLMDVHAQSDQDLSRISVYHERTPDCWIRIRLADDLVLPHNWLADHPRCSPAISSKRGELASKLESLANQHRMKVDLLHGLDEFLKAKGIKGRLNKWAMKVARKAVQTM